MQIKCQVYFSIDNFKKKSILYSMNFKYTNKLKCYICDKVLVDSIYPVNMYVVIFKNKIIKICETCKNKCYGEGSI